MEMRPLQLLFFSYHRRTEAAAPCVPTDFRAIFAERPPHGGLRNSIRVLISLRRGYQTQGHLHNARRVLRGLNRTKLSVTPIPPHYSERGHQQSQSFSRPTRPTSHVLFRSLAEFRAAEATSALRSKANIGGCNRNAR